MQALSWNNSPPLSYPVLIELDQENHWIASVVGWADAKGVGTTRDSLFGKDLEQFKKNKYI